MAEATPLQGLTFLNTRDARAAPELSQRLRELGAQVLECPTIAIVPPASWAAFDERLERLAEGDWIVFGSANAVRATLARLAERQRPVATLARARLAAIGAGTGAALERAGLVVALQPATAQQEPLLAALLERLGGAAPPQRVWLPRAEVAREVLETGLRAAGHRVDATPVYRTVRPPEGLGPARVALLAGRIDWLLFTSPSTVNHFCELLDAAVRGALAPQRPRVACIGAVTAQAAREQGLAVDVVPERQDLDGLLAAVAASVRKEGSGRAGAAGSAASRP